MDPQEKDLTLADIILKLHQDHPGKFGTFYALVALFILGILLGLWQLWGAGPRRRRGMRSARKLLQAGNWNGALTQLKLIRNIGLPSSAWQKTFAEFEGQCLKAAYAAALKDKKFEDALKFGTNAAKLLDEPEYEVRTSVQSAMVGEIRSLFAKHGQTDAVMDLIIKALMVQSPCREASFWQAMCEIRLGALEPALTHLQVARTGRARDLNLDDGFSDPAAPDAPPAPPSPFLDPPLYLGALLLRMERAKEALRFLTEANRMEPNCPFVRLQLGAAIVAAGGDTNMAVRALQFALGPKGLGQWVENPHRAWVEGFPENRSYVRKLAEESTFTCPLFGEDMKYLLRQGNLALAQGQFKLGNFADAAVLFDRVLKEGAPSLPVLRGLGLSLAKLGRFDDAFIHLRTAHEMEPEKDRLTAGYLALCGAAGKPARPEDKLQNIAWALRLVAQFNVPGDLEWVAILNRIFAEARAHAIPVSGDDQLYLCEHLVSIKAHDAVSAQAFHHLMATEPRLVVPEYAWLYCQADAEHDVGGDQALAMYIRTFRDPEAAGVFYAAQGWNFEEVELMFLARSAERVPGHFPGVLGPEYPRRGEQLLLAKADQLEKAGDREAALGTIEVLVKLSPGNTSAMDRAAGLHFRSGRLAPALELLGQWHQTEPNKPTPLVRQAILQHHQGDDAGCFEKLRQAMGLTTGKRRGNIAFLGARVALQSHLTPRPGGNADPGVLPMAVDFLRDALANEPNHEHALWCLAAVNWLQGDTAALANQASQMDNAAVADGRYHYFAGLCCHLAGNFDAAVAACQRLAQQVGSNGAKSQRELGLEAGYIAGLANLGKNDLNAAIDAFKQATSHPGSPTLSLAQGQLASALFRAQRHDEAIAVWQALDANKRQAWNLSEPLAQTTFISALESLLRARYEQASEQFRQAGRLGYRDRRLGPLLLLALFKAGQQAIYADETAAVSAPSV